MKKILLALSLTYTVQIQALTTNQINKIVDAIYVVEGGSKTKYPYGIKSVKTSNPRKVCFNTVRNNYVRWKNGDRKKSYMEFLADVYCPKSADPLGNERWKKNMKKMGLY
jgi:hypothetical protein